MKKFALFTLVICILGSVNIVFAGTFDSLQGLTDDQMQQLTKIQNTFKQENNSLEMRIMEYNNKMARIMNDKEKTPEQVSLLAGAYERNLSTLKTQQKLLEQQTDMLYKSVLTDEQYKQYKAQQINVDESFKKFLQK